MAIATVRRLGGDRVGAGAALEQVGIRFWILFGALVLDCLNRTENAMTQAHAFKAAELCLKAQALADATRGPA